MHFLVTPTQIEPHNETQIRIHWNTGEDHILDYSELRFHCPCAGCVDEHTGKRTLDRNSIPADIRPKGMELVGRYAIQVTWSDGHATGMYHFDTLYRLCQKHKSTQ